MRAGFFLTVMFAFAACDSSPLSGGDTPFVYATDGTDQALDLVQAPSGDLIVVGSTEGTPRPADGTLALPSVLRFGLDGELLSAEVYRDVEYGDVEGVAWARDGLVLALSAGPDGEGDRTTGVYRADERGRRKATLLGLQGGYLPRGALVSTSGGRVTGAVYASATEPQVYQLSPSGEVLWSVRLDGSQDVRGLAEGPGGDVYAFGPGPQGWIVARLDGDTGAERWRQVREADWTLTAMAHTSDGVALVENRATFAEGSEVRVVRFGADGEVGQPVTIEQTPGAPDAETPPSEFLRGTAIVEVPGGLAVGLVRSKGWETAPVASVVVLAEDGTERARERFGVAGRWVDLSAIERLADGRIAVAGAVGPKQVSGYGGDDFDIWVSLYDLD